MKVVGKASSYIAPNSDELVPTVETEVLVDAVSIFKKVHLLNSLCSKTFWF